MTLQLQRIGCLDAQRLSRSHIGKLMIAKPGEGVYELSSLDVYQLSHLSKGEPKDQGVQGGLSCGR